MIFLNFVFKLPDPKINKICASKTKKAALLKYILKNLKASFPHAINFLEGERKESKYFI